MTRIDFYLLNTGSAAHFACRLTDKAFRLGHETYIFTPDPAVSEELDGLLWTFSPGSFIPHAVHPVAVGDTPPPVLIGHTPPPDSSHQLLINLGAELPDWFSRFARVAEVVGADENDKTRARARFRFYRERGYPLETHTI